MRNPFRVKKQRQTWEGRPRALTLDDPVFQGWDEEELEFKPKHRKSDEDLQKISSATNDDDSGNGDGGGDGAILPNNDHSGPRYNHDNTLGYAPIAAAGADSVAQSRQPRNESGAGAPGSSSADGGASAGSSGSGL